MKSKKLIFSLAALWGGRTNETNWKYENAVTLLDHIKKRNKMDIFYGFELENIWIGGMIARAQKYFRYYTLNSFVMNLLSVPYQNILR